MNAKWLEERLRDAVNNGYGGCTHDDIDKAVAKDDGYHLSEEEKNEDAFTQRYF